MFTERLMPSHYYPEGAGLLASEKLDGNSGHFCNRCEELVSEDDIREFDLKNEKCDSCHVELMIEEEEEEEGVGA